MNTVYNFYKSQSVQRVLRYAPKSFGSKLLSISKRSLTRLGLCDDGWSEWTRRFGKVRIYKDDIFIVSYPKSGNTWVRFLIAQLLHPNSGDSTNLHNIDSKIPDLHVSASRAYLDSIPRPRFIKTHYPGFEYFPKFIYIYRDGRDVMVSYYHYLVNLELFNGTFSEFLREALLPEGTPGHPMRTWHSHVERALDYARAHPTRVLMLQYERMLDDPVEATTRLASFCGIAVTHEKIVQAVQKCSFSELQRIEQAYGSGRHMVTKENARFFRAGRTRQWQENFSKADMEEFLRHAGSTLVRLGYSIEPL
jgi:estrone sulfotransferase